MPGAKKIGLGLGGSSLTRLPARDRPHECLYLSVCAKDAAPIRQGGPQTLARANSARLRPLRPHASRLTRRPVARGERQRGRAAPDQLFATHARELPGRFRSRS